MMSSMGERGSRIVVIAMAAGCLSVAFAGVRQRPPVPAEQAMPELPQTPKPPFPYQQEEVTYRNPEGNIRLAGTLTEPSGSGPYPAALLITGAGPQDRDETIAGHKPFLVLADYLTRHGIAVLRVDDRGTGKSTGWFEIATTQDFASDAEASIRFLQGRPEVDQKHIGCIGHGEGAIVAPMVAVKIPQISFLVLLAGTAIPGEQVLLSQMERSEKAANLPEKEIKEDEKIGRALYDVARKGKGTVDYPEGDEEFMAKWEKQLYRLRTPWIRFFLAYDPAPTLEKVKCPVLALDGSKDLEVDAEQNAAAMKAAFARGGNPDTTIQILPGLNYMFQPAETGLGWEYQMIPETISPKVLDIIGDWIRKQTS